jgi:WD40 repeat protein
LKSYVFLALIITVFFSACSTKEVFEPKKVSSDWEKYEDSKIDIIDTAANIALLEDRSVLTDDGILPLDINTTQRVISQSNGWILTASIDGNLTLISEKNASITKEFELKKTIAGASVSEDTLAVLFADNEIALYDMNSKVILFKEQESKYIVADSRIVNPHFMKGIVLFATLDGKVVFVNQKQHKRLRTTIISSEENFNNVISLNIVENKIIAATSYTILSMAEKEVRVKYEIRNIVYDKHTIFIATKQGEVISLSSNLDVNLKVKFPFAHFYGMIADKKNLYILEKEGYMIVVNKKTFAYTIHEIDFDDGFIFNNGKEFYISDKKIFTE